MLFRGRSGLGRSLEQHASFSAMQDAMRTKDPMRSARSGRS